jgi:hypothetical protein
MGNGASKGAPRPQHEETSAVEDEYTQGPRISKAELERKQNSIYEAAVPATNSTSPNIEANHNHHHHYHHQTPVAEEKKRYVATPAKKGENVNSRDHQPRSPREVEEEEVGIQEDPQNWHSLKILMSFRY